MFDSSLHEPTTLFPPNHRLALPFSERRVLLLLGDTLCLGVAMLCALQVGSWIWSDQQISRTAAYLSLLVILALLWLGLSAMVEAYDLQVANALTRSVRALVATALQVAILTLPVTLLYRWLIVATLGAQRVSVPVSFDRLALRAGLFLLVVTALTLLWRLAYSRLFASPLLRRRVLVIGTGPAALELVHTVRRYAGDYHLLGLIDDGGQCAYTTPPDLPVLGQLPDLLTTVLHTHADDLFLANDGPLPVAVVGALAHCRERGLAIKPLSVVYEELMGWVPVANLGSESFPIPLWDTNNLPVLYELLKRTGDWLLAVLGLLLCMPLLPLLALAIVLDSPGPIFYRQERLGQSGRVFQLLKFRSMITNAEPGGVARWATRGDARITRVGRVLRRTRLDELPQLLNVLRGEMSIVGPRPERPTLVAKLEQQIPFYRMRLSVRPGLTGWAQIKEGYTSTVDGARRKVQYDLYYIKHRSLTLDLLIMLRTVKVIATFGGT